jgi:DNA-binding beta-propeller fold protein YncE
MRIQSGTTCQSVLLRNALAALAVAMLSMGALPGQAAPSLSTSITQIIDSTGDGAGHALDRPAGIVVDGSGNIYIAAVDTDNVFQIDPNSVVTQIMDSTGDGAGNVLNFPHRMAVDEPGNVYVSGYYSNNVFRIEPGGVITEIIDYSGDGAGGICQRL